ncbi:hypothetical protein [Sphingomonas glacialis]|uniref:Uncharacterized protein n=1 Tax=Sphingomonas glacialis TaxID=658225 RepID=A0A502FQ72_9SPHN|nr:hypothetical protein [Sphingomonas glacialis]TPG51697.1 hypothetical protein EAH76_16945 [Sphingomonas glacialis]
MQHHRTLGLAAIGIVAATAAIAQERVAPNAWGYDFAPRYDPEVAAPAVHRIRYADDHILLMEVANPPGFAMQLHGHPYPSIFARSSGTTHLGGGGPGDQYLEPSGGRNGEHWHSAPPPKGTPELECTAADPQAPHRPVNRGTVPQHFYRIEFRHFDDTGAPAAARSGETALYEDAVVRLVAVRVAPGASSRPTATRYPAILAIDTQRAFDALDAVVGPAAGRALPPTGLAMPRCMTLDAGAVLALHNAGSAALHYYRLDFKRIEGAALAEQWRTWYPAMTTMR